MSSESEVEMFVAGLVVDPSSNAPIVILKNGAGDVCLPIWIGLAEARAIASALKHEPVIRPLTHDLLNNMIDELGGKVGRVSIVGLEENTFFATIEVIVGEVVKIIDSRPSDAIALAVRVGASVMVSSDVLSRAQVTLVAVPLSGEGGDDSGEGEGEGDESVGVADLPVEERTESQNFAGIEKEKWGEILADMDPDDFKYKM